MSEAEQILRGAGTILIVDWPSRDVPDTLARAGYTVLVKGGPRPDNYWAYEVRNGEVVPRRTGQAPAAADLVYSHRPVAELPGIVAMADLANPVLPRHDKCKRNARGGSSVVRAGDS